MNTDSTANVNPTRVEELWFADGNVVIQAGNSLFRVTKGILAARSSTFCDLFALPQSGDFETVDGCPFVRLPDSAEDATAFLRAVFDSSFFERPPNPTTLSDILGILRLSHKYDVAYLRRRALLHLETRYPTTLEAYDASPTAATFDVTNHSDHLLVARLAMQVDAPWICPAALYSACCANIESICGLDSGDPRVPDFLPKAWIIGCAKQHQAYASRPSYYVYIMLPSTRRTCLRPEFCIEVAAKLVDLMAVGDYRAWPDPLKTWRLEATAARPWCGHCLDVSRPKCATYRVEWWSCMPLNYGFPSWPELLAIRDAALS
ncbi:hypothetical protein B0H15DRAFT_879773 [Mycena belliarum]|uniref:BTB domain-containing protein n=1 Tax=Mycena belliarum TaxID=1033014 RepID=A0AAD6UBQ6_9AGAR|nr:hypothetical protein B0H15DRAFT_879773 [Mycena belliae]